MARTLTPEGYVTACITDYLKLRGAWFYKTHGHLGQVPGIPDLVGIFRGRGFGIEVKVERPLNTPKQIAGFLSPEQRGHLLAIHRAGGMALVATDVDDVIRAFEGS
jgi:hypothetical protein